MKICIVTEFEQENFFQWTIALNGISKHQIVSLVMNPEVLVFYNEKSNYWNPIREADVVFVYCVRQNKRWKWFKLPFFVKKRMNKNAKMICQFDLEFLWLFYPEHFAWSEIDPWSKGKTPKEFFEETEVLEIADAYIAFFNPELEKYTSKPIFNIPLPQLVRYQSFLFNEPSNDDLQKKTKKIAIIHHSVKSAHVSHTIENLIVNTKSTHPILLFNCRSNDTLENLNLIKDVPLRGKSEVCGQINRDSYMQMLEKCYVAVDDNEGYNGWSRFVLECALTHTPCVGSTIAVKEFFPELYTKHKDYKTQNILIEKLYNDKEFWFRMAKDGKTNVLNKMDTTKLVNDFIKVVEKVNTNNIIKKTELKPKINLVDERQIFYKRMEESYQDYRAYALNNFPHSIPNRPTSDGMVADNIKKELLTQEMWDLFYGGWREFIEGKKLEDIVKEKFKSLTDSLEKSKVKKPELAPILNKPILNKNENTIFESFSENMLPCDTYIHDSGVKFAVPMPDTTDIVSWHSEGGFMKEMLRQGKVCEDEIPEWVFWQLAITGLPLRRISVPNGKNYKICARLVDLHHNPIDIVNRINRSKIDVLFVTYKDVPYILDWQRGRQWIKIKEFHPKDYYWKNIKAKIFWLPHSYDENLYYASNKSRYDVAFFGIVSDSYPLRRRVNEELAGLCEENDWSLLRKTRPNFFKSIKKMNSVKGSIDTKELLAGKDYAEALRLSKVFIFGTSILKYPLKRWFEALGSGTCILANAPQNADELGFVDGETYVEINRLNWKDKLKWILNDENERKRIARNGLKLAQNKHTHKVRVEEMFKILKEEG